MSDTPAPRSGSLSQNLASEIRRLREAAGLSRAQLAARCVPPTVSQQIEKLERGERRLTIDWIERVSRGLGVNVLSEGTNQSSFIRRLPTGAHEDPDNPGWYSWGDFPRGSFAAQTGRLLFKPDGEGQARTRMFPNESHLNMGGSIHGGAVMSFIDMTLFAGGRCAGMAEGHYVTLDCATHFIARGRIDVPLDAVVRLVGQTKGGHVFLSGHCEQDGQPTHSFTGTLKRVTRANGPAKE